MNRPPQDVPVLCLIVPESGPHLVVVAVGDGVGVDPGLFHLKEDPDGQDRLPVLTTQLHQHPVAHLGVHRARRLLYVILALKCEMIT